MRRALAALALTCGLGWLAWPVQASVATPVVRVADRSPLTVAGSAFGSDAAVTLTVVSPGVTVRRAVRADDAGRFRVAVERVSLTGRLRCGAGVVIIARSRSGRLALWHASLPDCPSPSRPPA